MQRLEDALIDDLEITMDFFDNESVCNVFLGELIDRRADMIEALIEKGEDSVRYKIQMIDEVIDMRNDIDSELKSRRSQMD